jgi:hypothetical protein
MVNPYREFGPWQHPLPLVALNRVGQTDTILHLSDSVGLKDLNSVGWLATNCQADSPALPDRIHQSKTPTVQFRHKLLIEPDRTT